MTRGLLIAIALLGIDGCGYRLGSGVRVFPSDVATIAIEAGENATMEAGFEKELALALEREFRRRGPLRVTNDPESGDIIVRCSVRSLDERPIAFNRNDEAVEYRATVMVDITMSRRGSGEVLWQAKGLSLAADYSSVASSVVTTSADFRARPLGASDVFAMTDIQLAESERRRALDRLSGRLAREIYSQLMEDF